MDLFFFFFTLPPSNGSLENLTTKCIKVDESNRTVFSAGWKLPAGTVARVNSVRPKCRDGGLSGWSLSGPELSVLH